MYCTRAWQFFRLFSLELNMATLNDIIDGGTLKGVEKKNLNSRAVSDISLKVTKGMQEQARIGLEMRKEFGRGGTAVGVKTANMIINDQMTVERVKKMYSYLKRHEVDKQAEGFNPGEEGYPSAGAIAWKLWGGQPSVVWSTKKRNQIEKEENASN